MIEEKESVLGSPKISSSLGMLAIMARLSGMLLGGMNKMLGLNDEKTPQKLAEEMMAGAIRGILEHFEYKLDEQKRQIEKLIEEKTKIEGERDLLKTELNDEKSLKTSPLKKKVKTKKQI